ncbi:basic helix-loop-helix transcription factor amos isoform X2 [Malaya genurostris]|uniref:basic helix-loop-helix transcription factor amos isoform X2 n=1 Tax=Malaya genurostris TaxID=325434 RepID=UPI0026F3FFDE|nr:basic helix-loop-helix transcription factor amos isoform X2 [Malaya genurostris]
MYNKMSSFDSSDGEICPPVCETEQYYESTNHYYTQMYPADSQNAGTHVLPLDEEGYWGSPCSSNESHDDRGEYSPSQNVLPSQPGPESSPFGNQYHLHQHGQQVYCSVGYDKTSYMCDEGYYGATPTTTTSSNGCSLSSINGSSPLVTGSQPVVRVVKRRNTANKKERRRTQSINSAYTSLRDRIPNVPNDTKLSKIKTLRLAISYIAHLLAVVNGSQDPSCDFRAELVPSSRKINAERRAQKNMMNNFSNDGKKIKGRTGWPQHVWALETKTTIK